MTPHQAVAFVRKHGVVLEAAAGPVPSLAEAIKGAPIHGSCLAHPRSHEIFELTVQYATPAMSSCATSSMAGSPTSIVVSGR